MSHPDIYCRLENFDSEPLGESSSLPDQPFPIFTSGTWAYRRKLHTKTTSILDPSKEQALEYLNQIFYQPAIACGFKLKYPTQIDIFPEIFETLVEMKDVRVICLTRKNSLKQAISKQNMERLLKLQNSKEDVQVASCNLVEQVDLPAFELDINRAVEYASELIRSGEGFLDKIEDFEHVFNVDYDEMVSNGEETFQRMLAFLKLTPFQLKSFFHKTTPDDLTKAISNFDELIQSVKDTPLAGMVN